MLQEVALKEFLRRSMPRLAGSATGGLLPWAQGVAGSNPVAPTTSLENLHNTQNDGELAESSAVLAICHVSPSIAVFHLRVGPKVGPRKSQLSDANVGGC